MNCSQYGSNEKGLVVLFIDGVQKAALERQLKDDIWYCSIQEQSPDAGRSLSFCASAKIIQIADHLEEVLASFLILGFKR